MSPGENRSKRFSMDVPYTPQTQWALLIHCLQWLPVPGGGTTTTQLWESSWDPTFHPSSTNWTPRGG